MCVASYVNCSLNFRYGLRRLMCDWFSNVLLCMMHFGILSVGIDYRKEIFYYQSTCLLVILRWCCARLRIWFYAANTENPCMSPGCILNYFDDSF